MGKDVTYGKIKDQLNPDQHPELLKMFEKIAPEKRLRN